MSDLIPIICHSGKRWQCQTCDKLFEGKADAIACCAPVDADQVSVVCCPVCGKARENTDFCCKPWRLERSIEYGDKYGWSGEKMERLRADLKGSKKLDWDNITVKYNDE